MRPFWPSSMTRALPPRPAASTLGQRSSKTWRIQVPAWKPQVSESPKARTVFMARLRHHQRGFFDEHLERLEQLGAQRAVDGAVIDRERAHHLGPDLDLVADNDGFLLTRTHRQDGRVRRIDDGGDILDAEHAEIGDGRGAALIFL